MRSACIAAIACLASVATVQAQIPDPLRIMPLGDSITVGYTDNPTWNEPFEFGYRSGLYTRLDNAGYNFLFVGGSTEPWTGISGDPTKGGTVTPTLDLRDFGQDGHRGYGGTTASGLQGGISSWLSTDDPDVILLKIGTNSQNQGTLNTLVNTITTQKPEAHLIIAEIMPKWNYQQGIVNYNTYIRDTLVPNYQAMGKKVTVVDQYVNFLTNPNDLTSIDQSRISNGINHPDNVGYDRMAQTWFDAIETLDFSDPGPGPGPGPGPDPVTITTMSSTTQFTYSGDVSSADLLHGITPTTTGWNTSNNASPLELTDGIHGVGFQQVPGDKVQGAWTTVGATAEYDLGTGDNDLGFDITSVQSIADWVNVGFGNQGWTIEVKGVGETAYTLLATVDYQPLGLGIGTTKVTLTDEADGVLASGVRFIKVTADSINGGANAGAFVWRELDVFGVSTVPEPGSLALLGIGVLALLRRR